MGSWFWIVIIAALAWQVVVAIMNERAKKQQEARLREAARQRRMAGQTGHAGASTPPSFNAPTTMEPAPPTGRGQSLAQRRQAQLDELRRRRQQQIEELRRREQVAQTPTSTPPVSPSSQSRLSPSMPSPLPSAPRQAPRPAQAKQATPAPTRGRPVGSARPARPDSRKKVIEPEGPAKTLVDLSKPSTEPSAYAQKPVDPSKGVQAVRPASPTTLAGVSRAKRGTDLGVLLGGGLKDAASLRRAILLKEILDPPIALRS